MYEFICSEEMHESMRLSASQVVPAPHQLLTGIVSLGLSTMESTDRESHCLRIERTCTNVECKQMNSLLDLLFAPAGMSYMIAVTRDVNSYVKLLRSTLSIDTCTLRCTRCGQYLGDGVFKGEETHCQKENCVCGIHFPETSYCQRALPLHPSIEWRDLSCVRLLASSVRILETAHARVIEPEQVLSRTIVSLNQRYGMRAFLVVPAGLVRHEEASTISSWSYLLLKLLSPSASCGFVTSSDGVCIVTPSSLQRFSKFSFTEGTINWTSVEGYTSPPCQEEYQVLILEDEDFHAVCCFLELG